MTNILHISCSPRGAGAESAWLGRALVHRLEQRHPGARITWRDICALPHVDADYAVSQQSAEDVSQEGSARLSDELLAEVELADMLVIATPVHNYTVPSALKAWIDHVVRVRRAFDIGASGKVPLLRDRPVYIAFASGGKFGGEDARQPDFLTPYLSAIFGMVGLHDLHFFSVQGTAFGPDALTAAKNQAQQNMDVHFSIAR